MAMTLDQLRKLADEEGFKYFLDPEREALMMGATGINGRYQFVLLLEVDGQFIQFRSINYLYCPVKHPHLLEVLKVLGELNYKLRLAKFGWDPRDGEIVAYADTWVMDNELTQSQFSRIVHNYLPAIDLNYKRIKTTMETGEDPGEFDPETALEQILGEEMGLPQELRDLIRQLQEEGKEEGGKKKGKKVPKL